MPYLGSKAATQFSGDGSNTAFTLEHAVGSDEDILVSVDGVIQEPSVAYAVSNGTTLTFTAAPSNNSGNNIFVYYLFRTVGTVSHPNNGALSASTGTFTGDVTVDTSTLKVDSSNNRVGVGTASPSDPLHVTASSGSRMARFEASQANSFIAFKDSNTNVMPTIGCTTDALEFKTASSGDPALGLKIDASGRVTMLKQPCFVAHGSSVTASGNVFLFQQVIQNVGSHYSTSTGRFTAPIAGTYIFYVTAIGSSTNDVYRYYTRKNGTVYPHANTHIRLDTGATGSEYGYGTSAIIMDMAASDYAEVYFSSDSSNASHGGSSSGHEVFSGHLLF